VSEPYPGCVQRGEALSGGQSGRAVPGAAHARARRSPAAEGVLVLSDGPARCVANAAAPGVGEVEGVVATIARDCCRRSTRRALLQNRRRGTPGGWGVVPSWPGYHLLALARGSARRSGVVRSAAGSASSSAMRSANRCAACAPSWASRNVVPVRGDPATTLIVLYCETIHRDENDYAMTGYPRFCQGVKPVFGVGGRGCGEQCCRLSPIASAVRVPWC